MPDCPLEEFDRRKIEERLALVQGRLRAAVAAAISRRKTPLLFFRVLGPDERLPGETGEGNHE